jgi:hypothetical protein
MPENCPNDVIPYAQSEIIRNSQLLNLNYTNQDFWSMKDRLVQFINERFGPNGTEIPNTFNDLVESDIAIMLIENWAFLADLLSFKMDQMVNELFIDTVTEPDNAFRLAKLVGFQPTPPIPAKTMWTATIVNALTDDLVIPTPVEVETAIDGIAMTVELFPGDYEQNAILDKDIIIPAGKTVISTIVGLEGKTTTNTYTGSGNTLQNYSTSDISVIFDSVSVMVDGIQWSKVDFFTDSQPRREYRVEFDSEYRAYIMFGDNRAGLSPGNGSAIEITYRVGGGTRGNIVSGYLEVQKQVNAPDLEFSIPITFKNYTKGVNGYDGDTIEDVRTKLPAWVRTQDRAVTGSDYKTLADQFATEYHGQVGKSTAILRNYGCSGNIIDLYILAKEGNALIEASDGLKVELHDELNDKKMITDYVCIKNGSVLYVDVLIEVITARSNRKFEQEIYANIIQKLNAFFNLNNWDYYQDLRTDDMMKALSDVRQVQGYEINLVTNNEDNSGSVITTKFYEVIRPDNIEISFTYV